MARTHVVAACLTGMALAALAAEPQGELILTEGAYCRAYFRSLILF